MFSFTYMLVYIFSDAGGYHQGSEGSDPCFLLGRCYWVLIDASYRKGRAESGAKTRQLGLPQAHFSNKSTTESLDVHCSKHTSQFQHPHGACLHSPGSLWPALRETTPTAPTTAVKVSFPPQKRFSKFRYSPPVTVSIKMDFMRITCWEPPVKANGS